MSAASRFQRAVAEGLADARVSAAVRKATLLKVLSRESGMRQLHDAEALRTLAADIKQHTLERLPDYLEQFILNAERRGAQVHLARDADAACALIGELAWQRGARLAVKSKSMTTEEVHLNPALQRRGVTVVETDLGEFIVQIDRDRPSHIVTPIIHKDRRQVAAAMARELGCEYTEDPRRLTELARLHLRDIFRRCDFGISGGNFLIAETGSLCICTNEGNGRMTVTRPRTHVALVGIEKLIPRMVDLAVFLKLLARSSTGQPLTVYTTLISGPRRPAEPDGPDELHIVLLDNGRSRLLGTEDAEVLRCIRCGACLNACPVYRAIGGHAYGGVYPGPIGSLVAPLLDGEFALSHLPRASSLCGACAVACPVRIDIPGRLVALRTRTVGRDPLAKRVGMLAWRWLMHTARRYRWAQERLRRTLRPGPDGWTRVGPGPLERWTRVRDLPPLPPQTFRQQWDAGLRDER